VQTYPAVRDCPLCRGVSKLEVRSHTHIYCRACHFAGDLLHLVGMLRYEEPFLSAQYLKACGWLTVSDEELTQYQATARSQAEVRKYFIDRSAELYKAPSPSMRSLFGALNASFSMETVKLLGPSVCWLSREHLLDHVPLDRKLSRKLLSSWGRYTAIGLPVWNESVVEGVYIISQPVCGFIPFVAAPDKRAAAFSLLTSATSTTVVMDSPVAALRMNLWRANEHGGATFVVPSGLNFDTDSYLGHRTVFWSASDSLPWIAAATGTPTASCLLSKTVGDMDITRRYPAGTSFGRIDNLLTQAETPYKVLARELSDLPTVAAAREALANVRLGPAEKSKIISYTLPQDIDRMKEYLDEGVQLQTVTWAGRLVSETHEGWVSDGKLISSAILRVDEIRARGAQGMAEVLGGVVYRGKCYAFRTELDALRKSPGEWVTRFVIDNAGSVPYIEPGWKGKLLELAQQFHEPRPVFQNKNYGWDGDQLRLPHFSITRHGIESVRAEADGPQIPLPSLLSPAEWAAFTSNGFCQLILALLVNLVRTRTGEAPYSLYLVNESHVLPRLSAFLCSRLLTPITAGEVYKSGDGPLPTVAQVTEDTLGLAFVGGRRKHLVISVDIKTASLLTVNSEWVKLRVQQVIDYPALRAVFHFLPELIRLDVRCSGEEDDFRRLAGYLVHAFKDQLPSANRLAASGFELDLHNRVGASNSATNILRLVLNGVTEKAIVPQYRLECVRIPLPEFRRYLRASAVPLPTIEDMTATLMGAQFLIEDANTGVWAFGRNIWDINSKIATAVSG